MNTILFILGLIFVWMLIGLVAVFIDIKFRVMKDFEPYTYKDMLQVSALGVITFCMIIFTLVERWFKTLGDLIKKLLNDYNIKMENDFWNKPRFVDDELDPVDEAFFFDDNTNTEDKPIKFNEAFPPEKGDGLGDGLIED